MPRPRDGKYTENKKYIFKQQKKLPNSTSLSKSAPVVYVS